MIASQRQLLRRKGLKYFPFSSENMKRALLKTCPNAEAENSVLWNNQRDAEQKQAEEAEAKAIWRHFEKQERRPSATRTAHRRYSGTATDHHHAEYWRRLGRRRSPRCTQFTFPGHFLYYDAFCRTIKSRVCLTLPTPMPRKRKSCRQVQPCRWSHFPTKHYTNGELLCRYGAKYRLCSRISYPPHSPRYQ